MILPLDPDLSDPAFNEIKPGWIPFVSVLVFLVIIALLVLAMRRSLRRIDAREQSEVEGDAELQDTTTE